MYWRVRKLDRQLIMKKMAIPAIMVVSVLLNVILILTRPNLNKIVSAEDTTKYEQFAKDVTRHLFDSSYITLEQNDNYLRAELTPGVLAALKKQGELPNSMTELRAMVEEATNSKKVVAVRIDSVELGEPDDKGMVPAAVTGVVALHSSGETGAQEQHFHLKYVIGLLTATKMPVVVSLDEGMGQ